uniref:hypothetical protein n=1 Tax=Roseivirga sp. TaxID=1964215 RepID=UPI0040478D16
MKRVLLILTFAIASSFSMSAEDLFGPAECREVKRDCKEFFKTVTGEYGPDERETCRAEKQACQDQQ